MSTRIIEQGSRTSRIPPLESGDRLSRDEFERRYEAMPEHVKAELVEGVVYMASPVAHEAHGQPDIRLATWIGMYQGMTPGTDCSSNGTVRLENDSEPQPDSFLFVRPEFGGQVEHSEDDYIERAPELVIEVAASRANLALGPKRRAYQKAGVKEYIVWRTLDDTIEWFVRRGEDFDTIRADGQGILKSEVFPGLWLDVAAALRRDTAAIWACLQLGLQSEEHARFVAELQARRLS